MRGRRVLSVLGGLMVAAGLLWAAQGSGLLPYPAMSPMVAQAPWAWVGLGLAAGGAVALWAARRR